MILFLVDNQKYSMKFKSGKYRGKKITFKKTYSLAFFDLRILYEKTSLIIFKLVYKRFLGSTRKRHFLDT